MNYDAGRSLMRSYVQTFARSSSAVFMSSIQKPNISPTGTLKK